VPSKMKAKIITLKYLITPTKMWPNSEVKDKEKYKLHRILNLKNACYHAGYRVVSSLLFIIIL
jgi:hypothetical protein